MISLKESRLFSLGLDWQGEKARVFVDAYDALDHVDGVTRGVNVSTAVEFETAESGYLT